jgi:hypothetical protein
VVLVLPFRAREHVGSVSVTLTRNHDPLALGCDASALDFPVCVAQVEFAARGYNAVLGWVQLVGETSAPGSERSFALDPLQVFEGVDTPFCWYGLAPTLFDAPSRRNRDSTVDWLALSFLCSSPAAVMSREVQPLVGFSWGFTMSPGNLDLVEPAALAPPDWDAQVGLLSSEFPGWRFLPWSTPCDLSRRSAHGNPSRPSWPIGLTDPTST